MNDINLDEIITNAINEAVNKHNVRKKYPSKNEDFDLGKINIHTLDKGWQRYHPYTLGIPHGHPLSYHSYIKEGKDYLKEMTNVRSVITNTFPISSKQFVIKKGYHGLYAAILVAVREDNVKIIEEAMDRLGFFRSQPTDVKLLSDTKQRTWLDIRFEPKLPDDITEEIKRKYNFVYHLAPSLFENKISTEGFRISNNNADFRYSEPRAYVTTGDVTLNDFQKLVNTLYEQAKQNNIPNLSNKYVLFKIDLSKINSDVRFFYDINEEKGMYTKTPINANAIMSKTYIYAQNQDKLPSNSIER